MDHLRTEIWDCLFKGGPQTITQLAHQLTMNEEMVKIAIDHEWFMASNQLVSIATTEGSAVH